MAATPNLGDVMDGYTFLGGDPSQQGSWRAVTNGGEGSGGSSPAPSGGGFVPPKPGEVRMGYRFKSGDWQNQDNWEQLHGEDYLKSLNDPTRAALIRQMVRGDLQPPSSFAIAKPYWQNVINQANTYDPNFSEANWAVRTNMRKQVSAGGQFANNLNAINTAIQHAANLSDKAKGVFGMQVPLLGSTLNWLGNKGMAMSGDPRITGYSSNMIDLAHELRRVYTQVGGGSQADLNAYEASMAPWLSTGQKNEALRTQMQLLAGKANSIYEQYIQGMGPNAPPLHVLNREAVQAMYHMGMTPDDLGFTAGSYADLPPQKAIDALKANHKLSGDFDRKYGANWSRVVLNGQP